MATCSASSRWVGRIAATGLAFACLAAWACLAGPAGGVLPKPAATTVGAIRWDAWGAWDLYPSTLRPAEWRSRLPFYATVGDSEGVKLRGDNAESMDREIRYAADAGLSYWAWCWYDPTTVEATQYHMNDGLALYRASGLRHRIRYCLIGGSFWSTRRWPQALAEYVAMFREPNYQKVLGNRPLLYYFMSEVTVAHFGTAARAREALTELREACVRAGLGPAYIVGLSFWPDKGAEAVAECGFDAMGSYTNPGGAEGKELPYSDLVGLNHWFWNECKATGKPFVPTVSSGWDYRPLMRPEFPERAPNGNWYRRPTPDELGTHVAGALEWVAREKATCPANTLLIYAWNEFAEGGWICPTLAERDAHLRSIGRAIRRAAAQGR